MECPGEYVRARGTVAPRRETGLHMRMASSSRPQSMFNPAIRDSPRRLARRPATKFIPSRASMGMRAPGAMVELRRGPGRNA